MKRGITFFTLILIIVMMSILTGVSVYFSDGFVEKVDRNDFILEFLNIQTSVENYYTLNNNYPTLDEVEVELDESNEHIVEQFNGEEIVSSKVKLNVLNLEEIGINETLFANYDDVKDSFAVSLKTGRIYYINGISFGDEYIHYTINDKLYNTSDINVDISGERVRVNDVVFIVSELEKTNGAVTVNVLLPKAATVNSINVTNSVSKGTETTYGEYKLIPINTSSAKVNYDVEVVYTINDVQKTSKYAVNNVDSTSPVISSSVTKKTGYSIINVTVTDNEDEKVVIKYDAGAITDKTYFEKYGKYVNGTDIYCYKSGTYTIYAVDSNGNSTLLQVSVTVA